MDENELAIELRLLREEVRGLRSEGNRVAPRTSRKALDADCYRLPLGRLYVAFKSSHPGGRAWQLVRNLLRPFVVAHWRKPVSVVTEAFWDEHRAQRRKAKTRNGRPPCEATLNLEMFRLKQMLQWAAKRKLIPANPLADCKRVKTKSRRESYFTESQVETLASGARFLRWDVQQRAFRALVALMAWTGMRISEALATRWDRIAVNGSTPVHGKGDKLRILAIPLDVMDLLRELEQHPESPFVFTNWNTGKPFADTTVREWFDTVIDATGLHLVKAKGDRKLVPHILRHSVASNAEERGAPLPLIQHALGHSLAATTAIYLHRDDTNAALKMAKIMTRRKPPRRSATESPVLSKEKLATKNAPGVRFFS